jgi:hypothetical protein
MSKTAKQDPTKAPAEPAATESAATQGEAQPEAAAEPEETGEATSETTSAADGAQPDLDETKRKFREALERKHQAHNDGQGRNGRDGSKINGAHGPAASRRNFRRKSG